MNIVVEARESGTSTGRHIDKLIENIYKLEPNKDITILTKKGRVDFFKSIAPGYKVIECNFKEFTFSEQIGLAWQLYKLRPKLVHFTMTQQPLLYFPRSITTIHDLTTARFTNPAKNLFIFKFKQLIYKAVVVWAAHKSKAILTISEYVKKDIAEFAHVNPNKINVTYLAADRIEEKAKPIGNLTSKAFIMYVGRPQPHKNLGRLIDAFVILQKTYPELRLVLAGKKDVLYEAYEKDVANRKIKNVLFTDFITEGQLRWLYENTLAYVFPSLSEGFGLPGLEAMAHGAPVVSSNYTCLPEIYSDAAHYFDPTDVADIAAKVSEVIEDKKLAAQLVNKGYEQVKKFSWAKMASQTNDIYDKSI